MKKKILIIRFGAIGDVVHTTVIQQAVKRRHPDCEIHFLVSGSIAPLLENDPNLAKVYYFDMTKKDNWLYLLQLGLQLKKEKFDVIFNMQNSLRNSFLAKIAGAQTVIKRSKNRVHALDAFFNAAKEVFTDIERPKALKLVVSPEVLCEVDAKIEKYPRPFIVIAPGGQNDKARQGRIWPIDYWSALSEKILETYGGTVFVTGSKSEKDYHMRISKNDSMVLLSGELSLVESAGLFSRADLFISGDSGPLHMAAALGVATVGIMGSTPASACGPYGEKCFAIISQYDCIACDKKRCKVAQNEPYTPCMESTASETVFDFLTENKLCCR